MISTGICSRFFDLNVCTDSSEEKISADLIFEVHSMRFP
jgi:hypothetical protein